MKIRRPASAGRLFPDGMARAGRMLVKTFFLISLVVSLAVSIPLGGEPESDFPAITGWTAHPDTAVYTPANLYDIIDGAADVYLSYGFMDLHTADYRSQSGLEVRVEIYRQSSPMNAFGVYSQERKPDYHFLNVGAQGYEDEGILNFLAGPRYIKLSTHATGGPAGEALRALARGLSEHLPDSGGLPPLLQLFPPAGKIQNGEMYIAENFLGYRALHSALVAPYTGGYQLFIMDCGSPEQARATLEAYCKGARLPVPQVREGALFTLNDPNNGKIGAALQGRFFGGVLNLADAKRRAAEIGRLASRLAR